APFFAGFFAAALRAVFFTAAFAMSMHPSKQVVRVCSRSQTANRMKVTSFRARASGACERQSCWRASLSNYAARKRPQANMHDVDRAKTSVADNAQVFAGKRV